MQSNISKQNRSSERSRLASQLIGYTAIVALLIVAILGLSDRYTSPSEKLVDIANAKFMANLPIAGESINADLATLNSNVNNRDDFVTIPVAYDEPAVKGQNQAVEKTVATTNSAIPSTEPAPAEKKIPNPFNHKQPAPSLTGGKGWLNTANPVELRDLRGKFVVLDFWTYCCINCMHVLPELKKLEKAFPNELVVIGVHSAKFDGEQDLKNIREAVLRHEIEHPVVNDADHVIWDKYAVNSWPSLRIIDPEGNLVAMHSGEVEFAVLRDFLKSVLPYYQQNKLLDAKPIKFDLEASKATATPLRFPGKVLAHEGSSRLFIADSNHNRIVVTDLDGKLLETIGNGIAGNSDGNFTTAQFDHPQGMALRNNILYVADTENHLLRKVDLQNKSVMTIAGIGEQGHNSWPGLPDNDARFGIATKLPERFVGPPRKTEINSPWDLAIHGDALYIAMAGSHQIWKMPLNESEIGPWAGNGREHISDGELLPKRPYQQGYSAFAQPSGLASNGLQLFVADSEGSAVRAIDLPIPNAPNAKTAMVTTLIGTPDEQGALFNFGDIDGSAEKARFQHCLAVAHDAGQIYVADTYNNKIKKVDLKTKTAKTFAGSGKPGKADSSGNPLASEFDEPAGLSIARGKLYVADTNSHAIRTIDLKSGEVKTLEFVALKAPDAPKADPQKVDTPAKPKKKPTFRNAKLVELKEATVKAKDGKISLVVDLDLPKGWHINDLTDYVYLIEAEGDKGPVDRKKIGEVGKNNEAKPTFTIPLDIVKDQAGKDSIKVSLNYYYCQDGENGVCKPGAVIWTLPLKIDDKAKESSVTLPYKIEE
jgi:thiol-disulfide isomerase/thioredoxin/DNA-binding beta-propeller fold protein YncE